MKQQKQILHHELEGTITFEEVLGKDVIDADGQNIGVTNNIHLHQKSLEVIGVSVDTGFLTEGLIIGAAYVKEVKEHAVFLNTRPVHLLKGMPVYDAQGGKIGTVKLVELNEGKNDIAVLFVKLPFFRQAAIPSSVIESVNDSVFLKVTKEELKRARRD